ncbi:hypothetical protein [Aliiruegeria lutimaris]|uniref:5-bromo-4-chloroindolyl phosphate hydrolysis protein n=1 Tax=Aliiruegeria lutimaris TaxID=571298 RepID=A0A1G8V3R0_9RHOB|nr:hypothetical protein [Aliiruegeria lutimaris]SDJ60497.1 hypothetical protein SAMN04488026_102065 [Aliiruegeria lutimaris]
MKYWGLGIAGALFYAAPIGAGMTGAPYIAVLAFTALFFLWVAVMKFEPFRDGPAMVLPTLMVHFALASACLGVGHLLRALLGIEATAPLMGWIVLGLGGIALGRILWRPRAEAEAEAIVEQALKKLNEFADDAEVLLDERDQIPLPEAVEEIAEMFGRLDALPAEGAAQNDLARIVLPVPETVSPSLLFPDLLQRARRTGARRDRHAALVLAFDTDFAEAAYAQHFMAQLFDLIVEAADVVTLAHFLARAEALLNETPHLLGDLPKISRMLEISDQIATAEPDLSEALVSLAQRREDLERMMNGYE